MDEKKREEDDPSLNAPDGTPHVAYIFRHEKHCTERDRPWTYRRCFNSVFLIVGLTGFVTAVLLVIAAEHHDKFTRETVASGVANLDIMLGGGLSTGSTTLLLGPAGVGKSTVAMQFAITAMKAGHKAAVYMFDEVLDTLVGRVEKLACA